MFHANIIFFSVYHAQGIVVDGFSVLIRWPKQLAPIWVPKCIFNVYNPNSMNSLIDEILCIIIHKIRIIYTWNVHIGTVLGFIFSPLSYFRERYHFIKLWSLVFSTVPTRNRLVAEEPFHTTYHRWLGWGLIIVSMIMTQRSGNSLSRLYHGR